MTPRWIFAAALMLQVGRCVQAQQIRPEEGRPQVAWQDARPMVGQVAFVFGKVIDVHTSGRITFINFDERRPARFAGVIFTENLKNFSRPPAELYRGKLVRILGTVSTFRNAPQVVITTPDQIEVLEKLPPLAAQKSPPQLSSAGEIRVAAYNLLNLFDDYDDPYHADEGTPAKPREQLERLASSIRQLNADVIAVEEVENRDYLERFVNVFLPDMGYREVVLIEGNDMRGIDVGLLSRLPVGEVRSHRHAQFPDQEGRPMRFHRDVLSVVIEPESAEPIDLWVLHLKSNSGGRETAEPIRLAEARQVRLMVDNALTAKPSARLVVLGDFNDTWGSPTLNTIVGEGERALWSAGSDCSDPAAVSYNEGEFRAMIVFMLCSPALAQNYVKGSYRVPQGSVGTTGSDHNPIVAAFKLE
jgi:endonuclease/exonuclease/phosphatase family metal-dependent hydrolase